MTEYTPEELAESESINAAIDGTTEAIIDIGLAIAEDGKERDGPMNSLLIAEGSLARIIAAFAMSYGGGEQEGLDDLLQISATHVRTLAQCAWDRLAAGKSEPEAADAPDA